MSRYIDIEPYEKDGWYLQKTYCDTYGAGVKTTPLKSVPTADVELIVQCKDCKYMTEHYDTDGNVPYWTCSEWDSGTDYNGYCHYGEKQSKRTRWNTVVNSNNSTTYYCPECGSIFNKGCADLGDFNFCPNCGADMRGE